MELTVTNCKDKTTQQLDEYIRQVQQYKNDIAKLQIERLLLEKDLKIIDTKIIAYQNLVIRLSIEIEAYDQLMRVANGASQDDNANHHSKVEFIRNVPDSVVAPSNFGTHAPANGLENDEPSVDDENEPFIGDVTGDENDSESQEIEANERKEANVEDYPLLNLLSPNINDTKTVGRKAKYRLKQQYTGMGIAEAAESYMSRTPGQKYHVNDLVNALYNGVNDSNALGVYKSLSTQLSLASKKKGKIRKHSNKATYYYS